MINSPPSPSQSLNDHHSSSPTNMNPSSTTDNPTFDSSSFHDNDNPQEDGPSMSSPPSVSDQQQQQQQPNVVNYVRNGKVPKPDDERKLFVGQLSSDVTKEDLHAYFSQFGSIENVTIKYDVPGGRARGFAFILYDNKDSLQKVLNVQSHFINQCQIDPKPAHRRPPVTNPVKKIFISQLPTDFLEQDLFDYFSQFGPIDLVELPMDREKSSRRPFGFISFLSEKTAEEVLRQQRHSINGTSIEVRPAKPRAHEQQMQMQQHYQYAEHMLPYHRGDMMSPNSATTMAPQPMMTLHAGANSYYPTGNNNNYGGQVDQWSQEGGMDNRGGGSYWNSTSGEVRANSTANSAPQWSTGTNGGYSSVGMNGGVYGGVANAFSSSSSLYQQPVFNHAGLAQANSYGHSSYSNHPQNSYGPSSSSTGGTYGGGYPSSSTLPNEILSSPSSWNQFGSAGISNGGHSANFDPNLYYTACYANFLAQQYYQQQQQHQQHQQHQQAQQQQQLAVDPSVSPNGVPIASNGGGLETNYQHPSR